MVAGKISYEALRDDQGDLSTEVRDSEEYSEEVRLTAAVLDNTQGLERLDWHKYAAGLADLGRGRLFETVRMIGDESNGAFKE